MKKETTDDTKQPVQQIEKPNKIRARLLARDNESFWSFDVSEPLLLDSYVQCGELDLPI